MARRNKRSAERFAMVPVSVLLHPEFKSMKVGYQRVLWLLAATYDGTNNGRLAMTRLQAKAFGLNNERNRAGGLAELERRGFIERTSSTSGLSSGGIKRPTTWALTWRAIDYMDGEKCGVVRLPSRAWEKREPDTHPESVPTRTLVAGNGSADTHPESVNPASPTRTLVAPSEISGTVRRNRHRSVTA